MDNRSSLRLLLSEMMERSSSAENFNAEAEMLKRKISRGLVYPGITETEFYKTKIEAIMETSKPKYRRVRTEGVSPDGKINKG
jgi:hypothetical protein